MKSKIRSQRSGSSNGFGILLAISITVATAFFIITYCNLFDTLAIMAKERLLDHPFLTFFITPTFFWLSAYLCRKYSPNAAGHHLQSALNQLKKDPNDFERSSVFLSTRLVIIKAISSLVSAFGGGSLGKEGPSVHMSAGIFAVFADRFKQFLPKINLEAWVFAGSAVGLTAAFNAPIAGITFVIEKMTKTKCKSFKQNLFLTLALVAIVTLVFHRPNSIFTFHKANFDLVAQWKLIIFTAVTCGFLALTLKSVSNYFYLKISNISSKWWHAIPLAIGLAVACINFYSGIYSFGGGIYTLQQIFASNEVLLSYKEVSGRILNTILTFSSGSAGGLIAPAMAIGAGIGSIISTLSPHCDIGVFLLIGMTAFLSVILGEPITAAIIIFETTRQDVASIPFLFSAAVISFAVWKLSTLALSQMVRPPAIK